MIRFALLFFLILPSAFGEELCERVLLGEGGLAHVYRVGQEVHKVYKSGVVNRDDLLALEFLREAFVASGIADQIQVVRPLRTEDDTGTAIFENNIGETLAKVVTNELLTSTERAKYVDRYLQARDRFEAYILDHYRSQILMTHSLKANPPEPLFDMRVFMIQQGGDYISIVLKPDNILVTTDGHLVLIDAY